MKDTIREFEEYLAQANSNKEAVKSTEEDDGEEEDDEFDDEEQEYTPEEVIVVTGAVTHMNLSLRALKETLQVITSVADTVEAAHGTASTTADSVVHSGSADPSLPIAADVASAEAVSAVSEVIIEPVLPSMEILLEWVNDVVSAAADVARAVTDYGIELYPPVSPESLEEPRQAFEQRINTLLNVVLRSSIIHFCPIKQRSELDAIRSVLV